MEKKIIAAAFDNVKAAERAVRELRTAGIPDKAISVLHRRSHENGSDETPQHGAADDKASGTAKGLGIGAGVGAVFGLAALVIPGVGPFIAAGALAETIGIVGSSAVSGAIVGGTAGGLSGALLDYGFDEDEVGYYEDRVRQGGYLVSVDSRLTTASADTLRSILHQAGGETHRLPTRQEECSRTSAQIQ